MPLLAYLWKVGATLLLLLFAADYYLPRASILEQTSVDRPAIRIHSDRKWPEQIVFDTRLPIIVPAAPTVKIPDVAMSSDVAELPVNRKDSPTAANALAMLPRPVTRSPESLVATNAAEHCMLRPGLGDKSSHTRLRYCGKGNSPGSALEPGNRRSDTVRTPILAAPIGTSHRHLLASGGTFVRRGGSGAPSSLQRRHR
ncbi:hypothetical protein [Bradyrhizobium tunisiense]|jgi:hypothetical protein|uniref:hypothetical protein n=1 Tax=Bradyrhizobium tunisiense TaxID=3278709 RepID=UPI0035DA1944